MSDIGIDYSAATAKNGASLKEYGATIGGKTVTSVGLSIAYGAPTVSGDAVNITVYAEDSRGYKTGHIASVAVKYYSNPQIVSWQARRKDSIGETVSLNVVFAVRSYLNSNLSGKKYRYRKTDDDTWSSWLDLGAVTQITSTMTDFKMYEFSDDDWEIFDADKSYYVQIWCSDNIGGEAYLIQFTIARGLPLVSFRDGMVGINNFNPTCGLDVKGGFKTDEFIGLTEVAYPTLHNDWEPFDTSHYARPEVTRIGNVCFLRGMLKQGIITKNTHIATVPQEFRPVRMHLFTMTAYNNAGTQGQIRIGIDGKICVNGNWDLPVSATYWNLNLFWTLGT